MQYLNQRFKLVGKRLELCIALITVQRPLWDRDLLTHESLKRDTRRMPSSPIADTLPGLYTKADAMLVRSLYPQYIEIKPHTSILLWNLHDWDPLPKEQFPFRCQSEFTHSRSSYTLKLPQTHPVPDNPVRMIGISLKTVELI